MILISLKGEYPSLHFQLQVAPGVPLALMYSVSFYFEFTWSSLSRKLSVLSGYLWLYLFRVYLDNVVGSFLRKFLLAFI